MVDLQNGLLVDRIKDPSQIPVCILPAQLLPVKTYSTIQKMVQVDLFFTKNLHTPSKNRCSAPEISLNLL